MLKLCNNNFLQAIGHSSAQVLIWSTELTIYSALHNEISETTQGVVDKVQTANQARDRAVPVSPLVQPCWALTEANNKLWDVTLLTVEITNTFGKQGWPKQLRFNLTTNLTTWSLYFRKRIYSSNPGKQKFSIVHDPESLNKFTTCPDIGSLKVGHDCLFRNIFITFPFYPWVWTSGIK